MFYHSNRKQTRAPRCTGWLLWDGFKGNHLTFSEVFKKLVRIRSNYSQACLTRQYDSWWDSLLYPCLSNTPWVWKFGLTLDIMMNLYGPHIILIFLNVVYVCMCVPAWVYGYHVHIGSLRVKRKVSDSLDQELQVVVSHLRWVLRTKHRYSARTLSTVNTGLSVQLL